MKGSKLACCAREFRNCRLVFALLLRGVSAAGIRSSIARLSLLLTRTVGFDVLVGYKSYDIALSVNASCTPDVFGRPHTVVGGMHTCTPPSPFRFKMPIANAASPIDLLESNLFVGFPATCMFIPQVVQVICPSRRAYRQRQSNQLLSVARVEYRFVLK